MLNFETFSLAALREALPYIRQNPYRCGDLSAGYLYMWHEGADLRFCVWNGTFCVRQTVGEQTAFSYPYGADPAGMTEELIAYARAEHLPLRFFAVDEGTLEAIRSDGRLQPATYAYDRRWSDYIYTAESACTYRGKKLSGQRNHVNRYTKLYGTPDARLLSSKDIPLIRNIHRSLPIQASRMIEPEFCNTRHNALPFLR